MEANDHDILIRNTTLTEETHKQLSVALQQLGRGNEKFQRIDAELIRLTVRVDEIERKWPETVATLRQDMLRAMGSVIERTDENTKASIDPIQKQLEPITNALNRIHTLFKWTFATISGIIIAVLTAAVTAWFLHLIPF